MLSPNLVREKLGEGQEKWRIYYSEDVVYIILLVLL